VIEHDPDAPAGLLGDWAAARGLRTHTVRLHAADPLPPPPGDGPPGPDAVAVLGSEHTAYDDTLPWLAAELAYLDAVVTASVPVLGICFGGQLLARLAGAALYRLAEPEIGWLSVHSLHPALPAGPWVTWHRDAFDVPSAAKELARTGACAQGFVLGPHVAVQFHPEATEPILGSWRAAAPPPHRSGEAAPFGDGGDDGRWAALPARAGALFSAWLDGELA
jgi:GMP synthase-like glutamine amidotransferase